MKNRYLQTQLVIICAVVITISSLLVIDFVLANPTLDPPDGNITISPGPQGVQGNTGSGGNTGGEGPRGYTGNTGPTGDAGYAYCNFPGYRVYMSHGWDGGCAWNAGMTMSCWTGARSGTFTRVGGNWPCTFTK